MDFLQKETKITTGTYKGKTLGKVIDADGKKGVFTLLREGYYFEDGLLAEVGIKKITHEPTIKNEIVEHAKENKVYKKDTMKAERIISELQTIANIGENKMDYFDTPKDSEQTIY